MEPVPINPDGLSPLGGAEGRPRARPAGGAGEFRELLARHLGEVNALQGKAQQAVRDLMAGQTGNLHEVIVAMSEADLSFRLMMQVRNKLLEAYKEIMRMQV
jgi:flagellar hook-basal body complex protein FliE